MSEHEEAVDRDDGSSGAKDAFSSIPEIQGYLHALGDYKKFNVMLFRSKPTMLSDGTKCSGRLRSVESPDDLDQDAIQREFGGGEFYIGVYEVGKKGIKKRYAFPLPGVAKLPAHMLDAKRAESGTSGNGNGGVSPNDNGLGQRAFNTLEKEGERHSRERELRDAEIRQLANDKAKAEAEAMMLKMRLAELEARPAQVQQQRSAEMIAAESMQMKAIAVLESGTRAQTAAAEARAAAAYEQMKEIRDRAEHNTANAAEPYKQMIQMISERHSQDTAAMNQQFQNMMAMQTQAHAQQMEIYRAELKAKEERNDRKSSMKEMTETIEQVQKIMDGFGANKEQSMADKLIEKVPPEAFSAVLAVLASALGGGALPAVPPPPALPAAPQAPQAPAGPSPEQQRKVIELVSNMKTLLQQKNPPIDTATYLNMSLGKDSTKLLLQSPVEELIQFLQSADPVFGGPDGEQWIRSVYSELRKTFK